MSFEQPKPGLYRCKVDEIEHGPSKAGNQQFKVVFKVQDGEFKGSNLFHYVPTDKSSGGYFRLAELTSALGLKPKGIIDTDKVVGKEVTVRVKSDVYEGEYKARVGAVLAPKAADEEDEDLDDDDLDDTEEEEAEVKDYTAMSLAELRAEAKEQGVDTAAALKGRKTAGDKKDGLIDALEAAADPDMDPDPDDDDEPEAEEDDDVSEAEDDYDEWTVDELKTELKDRGLRVAGKQVVLIGRLRKDDESDEDPFAA